MYRRNRNLFGRCCAAATVFLIFLLAGEAEGFQFSMKSRTTQSASSHPKPSAHFRDNPRTAWPYRHRQSRRFPISNRMHYSVGYYALPFHWGNQRDANFQSRVVSSELSDNYPSNITGYDSEFRSTMTQLRKPARSSIDSTELTISNDAYVQPQQTLHSHFDLQQRLLELRQTPLIKSATAASNLQGHAEKAFREGRYYDAAYYSDHAVQEDPYNGLMRLFCSQSHFAIGKYSVAILMLEQATTMLPEDQWDYVVKHYDTFYGQNDYVTQTRVLANYLKRRADDNRARTLLGYHYGCLGYKTTASALFHQSLQTYRNDELAQRLLPIFGDAGYASTVVKEVQAPTPELLDDPWGNDGETGNRLIYLTPQQTEPLPALEELPSPEEIFFKDKESILMPAIESP